MASGPSHHGDIGDPADAGNEEGWNPDGEEPADRALRAGGLPGPDGGVDGAGQGHGDGEGDDRRHRQGGAVAGVGAGGEPGGAAARDEGGPPGQQWPQGPVGHAQGSDRGEEPHGGAGHRALPRVVEVHTGRGHLRHLHPLRVTHGQRALEGGHDQPQEHDADDHPLPPPGPGLRSRGLPQRLHLGDRRRPPGRPHRAQDAEQHRHGDGQRHPEARHDDGQILRKHVELPPGEQVDADQRQAGHRPHGASEQPDHPDLREDDAADAAAGDAQDLPQRVGALLGRDGQAQRRGQDDGGGQPRVGDKAGADDVGSIDELGRTLGLGPVQGAVPGGDDDADDGAADRGDEQRP